MILPALDTRDYRPVRLLWSDEGRDERPDQPLVARLLPDDSAAAHSPTCSQFCADTWHSQVITLFFL